MSTIDQDRAPAAPGDGASASTWRVDIQLGEHDGRTRAVARLRTHDSTALVGTGLARLDPADRDVPEIGAELASARALRDLADRLLKAAAGDIADLTHEDVDPGELR